MSLARGLFVQLQVVHALVLREIKTRFGEHQLGYLWALLSPLLLVGTFYALYVLGERSAPSGMTLGAFMVTGVIPYQAFRETAGRLTVAIGSNRGLLFYPQVRPLDLMLSRALLEGATAVVVFVLLMGGAALFEGRFEVESLLLVFYGFGLAIALGVGMGMVLGSLSVLATSVENWAGALLRPLFWLSAIFYSANDLPPGVLEVVRYNPLLHVIELVRTGWFPSYQTRVGELWYPLAWAVLLLFFGLVFERGTRARLEVA